MMAIALTGILASFVSLQAADHFAIPVSNPLKPVTVKIALYAGSISVTGFSGKEVIMDVNSSGESQKNRTRSDAFAKPNALKRISSPMTSLTVQEENNVVSIDSVKAGRSMNVALQVPVRTNLILSNRGKGNINVNQVDGDVRISDAASPGTSKNKVASRGAGGGNIDINQVKGEIEISNAHGNVNLSQVSGNAVVYASNGNIRASFFHVEQGKPMSFCSMNGILDIWLPPGIKANVSTQSSKGEIHSDFDIKIDSATVQPPPGKSRSYGISRISRVSGSGSVDRMVTGKINGGGQDIRLKTYRGNIYIRKFSDAPHSTSRR